MGIVDDLLENPGVYLGIDTDRNAGRSTAGGAARMVVTPLPGRSGVEVDYEVINPAEPEHLRGHIEHTVLARTHDGGVVMVIGHMHSDSVAILRETEPGVFELGAEGSPFPLRIEISVPEPGRLLHSWFYGSPGKEVVQRDSSVLTRV